MRMGSTGVGYLIAVVQAILYAGMGVIGKFLYGTGLNPEQVTSIRFIGAVVIVGAVLLVRRKPFLSRSPLVYAQALFFAASAYLYLVAVDHLTAGLGTVIFYTYPAIVALMAVFALRERLTARTVAALVLAMAGIVLISGILAPQELRLSALGIVLAVAASVAFAIYMIIGQKTVAKDEQLTLTFTMSAVSALLCVVLFPTQLPPLLHMTPLQWGMGFAIALLCTVLPVFLLLAAIKRIGSTKASLISILETPFSLLLAFAVLGETLTGMQGAGCLLVVASIVVTTLPARSGKEKGKGKEAEAGDAPS